MSPLFGEAVLAYTRRARAVLAYRRQWLFRLALRTYAALGHPDLTLNTVHGRLTVHTRDTAITLELIRHHKYQHAQIAAVAALLARHGHQPESRRSIGIDVGANIGTVALSLIRDGVVGHVLAVEPDPANYRLLQRNVAQNGMAGKIDCRQVALSDQAGELLLEQSIDNMGDHRIRVGRPDVPSELGEDQRPVTHVPALTLDELLGREGIAPTDVRLVWMDVQGHEGHVLRGASSLLVQGVPIATELWPYGLRRSGTSTDDLLAIFAPHYTHAVRLDGSVEVLGTIPQLRATLPGPGSPTPPGLQFDYLFLRILARAFPH